MNLGTAQPYIASYVIFRKGDKVAFVLRSGTNWMDGYYGLAAGKVEEDESFTQAAIREAKEEVGIQLKESSLKQVFTMHRRDPESDIKFWVDVFFEVTEWEGELFNAEPHMHSEVAWLDTNNLPENIITSIRFVLSEIAKGHNYAEYGWDI